MSQKDYTTAEAATVLTLKQETVVRYIRRGLLTAHKRGGVYFITAKELARFQRERRSVGKPVKKRR